MKVTVESRVPADANADLLVLTIPTLPKKKKPLAPEIAGVDRALGGQIRAVIDSHDFQGKAGERLMLYRARGRQMKRVLLLGLGDEAKLDAEALRSAGGRALAEARSRKAARLAVSIPAAPGLEATAAAQAMAEGAVLASYRFDDYRGSDDDPAFDVRAVMLLARHRADLRSARQAAERAVILAESQNISRQLSNQPANELTPAGLALAAQGVAREVGLRVSVMDVAQMKRRKMGAILAVGQGSTNPPRMVTLQYRPPGRSKAAKAAKPICIVGKGVTFDSGGISIKPSAGMDEMKHDMSGAAAVVGAMRACALLELPVPVVGIIGAAENMPSATAYRPGDVVRAMSGKTIEVLNTDAEGRVVLADALHLALTDHEPAAIVDLATLTGACVVALGGSATGLFGNCDPLIERLRSAGEATGERVWPMPLFEDHKKEIRSQVADIKNTGGRSAGASTAAAFLSHFVGKTPWAHLDIAGTGWTSKTGPYQPRGATGVGVRLLLEALRDWDPSGLAQNVRPA